MVFETVEVLVAFATDVAGVGFVFFHSSRAGVYLLCVRVDDGKGAVAVVEDFVGLVTMLYYVSGTRDATDVSFLTDLWYLSPFWFLYAFSQPMTGQ